MNLSIKKLDLSRIPFASRLNYLAFVADRPGDQFGVEGEALYLTLTYGMSGGSTRWDIIKVEPIYGGQILPYTYTATPGLLTIETLRGNIEICFEGRDNVLFRTTAEGLGIHFSLNFMPHELFLDRLDGTVHTSLRDMGEFLFENPGGKLEHNGGWIGPMMRPKPCYVNYLPGPGGRLEAYIHHARSSVNRPGRLASFDDSVAKTRENFEEFCRIYDFDTPEKYREAKMTAIYAVWQCYVTVPSGNSSAAVMYMMRTGMLVRAMGWHPSYHAIAAAGDIDQAIEYLYSNTPFMDEYGQIPDGLNDIFTDMHCTKPPFQGFAWEYLENKYGPEKITKAHCEKLYGPMKKWAAWWRTFRDIDGNGIIDYVHADESGWDDSSIFSRGMPVESPDSMAFMILMLEMLSKMARKLGKDDEADSYMADANKMLEDLIKIFWNGEKFVCRMTGTHEIVDFESIAMYQPIILGKRLPQVIIDKIAAKLESPEFFNEKDGGLYSESRKSPYFTIGTAFMMGRMLAPVQFMMALGLDNAGKRDLALKIAGAFCDWTLRKGLVAMEIEIPETKDPLAIVPQSFVPGCAWISWSGAIFLSLVRLLKEAA
ncbi:MAG: hypothetical protein LBG07_10875 [Treponema sp.]|nr:hypothetical protein [Treponema sp.]